MLIERYLEAEVHRLFSASRAEHITVPMLKKMSEVRQIVYDSADLLCLPGAEIRQIYAMQDQTEASRLNALYIGASLAKAEKHSFLNQGLVSAAQASGIALREVECDSIPGDGLIGKIDRSWYVLGGPISMQAEGIELGVTSLTLAERMEESGAYPLFLAQKGPKRLLSLFAVGWRLNPVAQEWVSEARKLGIKSTLISLDPPKITHAFFNQIPDLEIITVPTAGAKRQQITSLCSEGKGVAILTTSETMVTLPKEALSIGVAEDVLSITDLTVQNPYNALDSLKLARSIMDKARRRFFWCKI